MIRRLLFALLLAASGAAASAEALNVDQLDSRDTEQLQAILQRLAPMIAAKKQDGTANLLTWGELYAPLTTDQQRLLSELRGLRAEPLGATSHYFGELTEAPELVPVGPHTIAKAGTAVPLDPQYLPRPVHNAYQAMMTAMEFTLGKRLLVESGYRSPAYQLYLFLFYMPKHGYSVRETNRFVALPGHSEHGAPHRQAIDFINQAGINGEDHPEEFEVLPEYHWLLEHAGAFGFHLSYPRNNPFNTAFEPWHWHYEAVMSDQ